MFNKEKDLNKNIKINKKKKGFTLVELVVVIAVIAILAGVSVAAYFGVTDSANRSAVEQTITDIKNLYTMYYLKSDSDGDLKDKIDSFVEFTYENGIQKNSLNYRLNNNNKESKSIDDETGIITFIYTDFNTGYAGLFNVSYENTILNNSIDENINVFKNFDEASSSIGYSDYYKNLNNFWELYLNEDNESIITNRVDILFNISGISFVLEQRELKNLNWNEINQYLPKTEYFVLDNKINANDSPSSDGKYYYEGNGFKLVDESGNDISLYQDYLIEGGEDKKINIKSEMGEAPNINNEEIVASIKQYSDIVIKRYNDNITPDEIDVDKSGKPTIYYFDNIENAINFAGEYETDTEIRLYKPASSGICGNTPEEDITDETEGYPILEKTFQYHEIDVLKTTTINSNVTLKTGVNLNLKVGPVDGSDSVQSFDNLYNVFTDKSKIDGQNYKNVVSEATLDTKPQIELKIGFGVTFNVFGYLNIGANLASLSNTVFANGSSYKVIPMGGLLDSEKTPFNQIYLEENSKLILNDNAELKIYGRACGEGKIICLDNSLIYEAGSIRDHKGGTNLMNCYFENVFPFVCYELNHNFVETIFSEGTTYTVFFPLRDGDGEIYDFTIDFISPLSNQNKSIFSILEGYLIRKTEEKITNFTLYGKMTDNEFEMRIDIFGGFNFNVSNFEFPLSNLHITLYSDSVLTLNHLFLKILPTSSIDVMENSIFNVNKGIVSFEKFEYYGYLNGNFGNFYKNEFNDLIGKGLNIYGTLNVGEDVSKFAGKIEVHNTGEILFKNNNKNIFSYEIKEYGLSTELNYEGVSEDKKEAFKNIILNIKLYFKESINIKNYFNFDENFNYEIQIVDNKGITIENNTVILKNENYTEGSLLKIIDLSDDSEIIYISLV